MKISESSVKESNSIIYSEETKKRTVKDYEHHFTRNRKLSYITLISLILTHFQTTIKTALNHFRLLEEANITVCQSAFSQARSKINDNVFHELFEMTAGIGYKNRKVFNKAEGKLFFGRQISAIDGSQIKLPYTAELKAYFGTSGQGDKAVTARCSVLYDILNDVITDARFDPFSHGERRQALEMLEKKHIFSGVKELIIFDRGYYSLDFMEELLSRSFEFVFRMPTKKLAQADELPNGIHTIKVTLNSGKIARVRVVKFDLPSGETETLVTNFYLQKLTIDDYKALYFMRWPVEIKFDIVKNKIQLENFTGRTVEAIYQDFYTCMYLTNMVSFFKSEADDDIRDLRKDKNNKYEYKTNTNEIVGAFKDRFIFAVLESSPSKRQKLVDRILDEIKQSVIPIRPGRSLPRPAASRKMKFYHNMKNNA